MEKKWDLFISHASEDKASVARPLAAILSKQGLRVWFDELSLTLGDSLRRKIDQGLAESRFGLVVLSKAFFSKEWPKRELDGLVAREIGEFKVILPVWHGVTHADVCQFSPTLADKLAANTGDGLKTIGARIANAIKQADAQSAPYVAVRSVRRKLPRKPQKKNAAVPHKSRQSNAISSGSTLLDAALGTGGWPCGFISQIYGPPGSGKSSLALAAVRQCQLSGRIPAYIDADRVLTKDTLARFGIVPDDILVSSPNSLDDALDVSLDLVLQSKIGLLVIDTIASLPARSSLKRTVDNMQPVEERDLIESFSRQVTATLRDSSIAILLINRVTEKVGVMFGNPEDIPWFTVPTKDLSSIIVDTRRRDYAKDSDGRITGFNIRAKCVKNRLGVPFIAADFLMDYRRGIRDMESIVQYAVNERLIKMHRGKQYRFEGDPVGDSYRAIVARMKRDKGFLARLRDAACAHLAGD